MSMTGFSAEIRPTLRQGDHTVVKIEYRRSNGDQIRIGHVIMHDSLIEEFMSLFPIKPQSQNVT